jgi:hypothetical protein
MFQYSDNRNCRSSSLWVVKGNGLLYIVNMNSMYFFIFFVLMWLGISILLSYWSGWKELAQYYRYQNELITKRKFLRWASLRGVSYKACLTIGGSVQGLYLSILFLFALGYPKLFIPWNDIKFAKKVYWGFPVLELSFTKATSVTLMVSPELGNLFQEISGRPLIIDETNYQQSAVSNKYLWVCIILGISGLITAIVVSLMAHK